MLQPLTILPDQPTDEERLAYLQGLNQYLDDYEKCTNSLHYFLTKAWSNIHPETFVDGWHLQAICEHLEALFRREIRNLLINIPPRMSKSTVASVAFPAWVWIHDPSERFLTLSHSFELATRDSVNCRRLITSDWYQALWGHKFQLLRDQNTKQRFDNDHNGYRITRSIRSRITGHGGSIITCLPYDMIILTDQGEIPIGDIVEDRINCKIASYNHDLDMIEYKEIEEYEKTKDSNKLIYEIILEDGQTFECTDDHPVYIVGQGYIQAKEIKKGDYVCQIP